MHWLLQSLIILIFYGSGLSIAKLLPVNFPGSIIGMFLLFLALFFKLIKPEQIRTVSRFFLGYMPLFFIPAGVSVMTSFALIQDQFFSILSILIISTLLVLSVTALIAQKLIKAEEHD